MDAEACEWGLCAMELPLQNCTLLLPAVDACLSGFTASLQLDSMFEWTEWKSDSRRQWMVMDGWVQWCWGGKWKGEGEKEKEERARQRHGPVGAHRDSTHRRAGTLPG